MANDSKKYISLTRLSNFLDNIKEKYSQIGHKHTVSDLTDYTPISVDNALSPTSTNPVQNKVLDAEFDAIGNAMGALELAIDNKSDANHNHNDSYYTKIEIDTSLSQKSQVKIITWEADD
jgi:hypothetical protein